MLRYHLTTQRHTWTDADERALQRRLQRLEPQLRHFRPDLVALDIRIVHQPRAEEYVGSFRLSLPGTVLVARASRAVSAALEPLGRMALTNYLTSTLFILAALPLLVRDTTHLSVLGYSAAVLAVQFAFGRWWLRTRRYGPLEWIWRCATWWRIVPNRRDPADPARYGAAGRTGGE